MKQALLFTLLLLFPLLSHAQRAGDLDRTFNYGHGANYQFNYGYNTNEIVRTSVIQPDGKILMTGVEFNFKMNVTEI